jgi:signal transduction histidine kinase
VGAARGLAPEGQVHTLAIPLEADHLVARAATERRLLLVEIPPQPGDPLLQATGLEGAIAQLAVPIVHSNELVGVVFTAGNHLKRVLPAELPVLNALVTLAANAVMENRRYAALKQLRRRLRLITEGAHAIAYCVTAEAIAEEATIYLKRLLADADVAVLVFTADEKQVQAVSTAPAREVSVPELNRLPLAHLLARRLQDAQYRFASRTLSADESQAISVIMGGDSSGHGLIVPFRSRNSGLLGGVVIAQRGAAAPEISTDEEVMVVLLAVQTAAALDVARSTTALVELKARSATESLQSQFVRKVAHELRTPLTSLVGFTELMATKDMPPEQLKLMAQEVHAGSKRLAALVDGLLDLMRLESGHAHLSIAPQDVAGLVRSQVAHYQRQHATHEYSLEVTGDIPALPVDAERFSQLIAELLANATRFSPAGSAVQVRLSVEGNRLKVAVQDHGEGIAPEHLERVFDPFYQVDTSLSDVRGGPGLGLSLCKRIAEAHNGSMWVESTVGQGSTFYVTLPLQQEEVK